jgi:hypothetical protein
MFKKTVANSNYAIKNIIVIAKVYTIKQVDLKMEAIRIRSKANHYQTKKFIPFWIPDKTCRFFSDDSFLMPFMNGKHSCGSRNPERIHTKKSKVLAKSGILD